MNRLFITISILMLIVFSCTTDDDENPILAGHDLGLNSFNFNPPLKLNLTYDTLLNLRIGKDSIDLNLDNKYDLFISQRLIESHDKSQINESNYPFCKLALRNGIEIAVKRETFYIGLGATNKIDWVDTIDYNIRIDKIANWSASNIDIFMWIVPPTIFWGSYGCWYELNAKEKYIGIRMKINSKYKQGWIKIIQQDRENIQVLSFALEK